MKIFLSLLCFIGITQISAQYTREDAKADLLQLRNSMLLVRLHTNDVAINYLESQGRAKEADRLKERQYLENKEIILSFSQAFDFCPVFFFYSEASDDIRQGNLEGNLFNAQQQPVEPHEFTEAYYTAEFSETENLGITGLIVMNDQLFPLESPFPFYQRKYTFMGLIALSKAKMIEQYNKKLHATYQLWFPEGATPQ